MPMYIHIYAWLFTFSSIQLTHFGSSIGARSAAPRQGRAD